MFVNFILKRTHYTGDIKKYQFLHYAIPSGVIAALSMASTGMTNLSYYIRANEDIPAALGIEAIGLIFSLASMIANVYTHALLLKTAIEEDAKNKFTTLKKLAIVVTVSSVLAYIITIVAYILLESTDFFVLIRRFFIYGLYIAVAWAVALVKTDNKKVEIVIYTILPILAIIL